MTQLVNGIRHASKPAIAGKPPGLRPDIQGLRALAVLLVVADHMFAYPLGGFVGVDVFFVISGFVITGSLLREQERRGRISFADFYRRRARRILPLSALVLLVTVAAGWAIFTAGRALKITEDGAWAFLFGANWHFALDGTNYMEADGVTSPLQHFWSLAVEEQFYFVWPWLIVLVAGVLASRLGWERRKMLAALAVSMVAISLTSFAFAMWETAASPTFAYFSTFSRAWELGAGSLLAVLGPALLRIPALVRPALGWLGLVGILGGAFLITPEYPFPGPWAAVPVLATMLVIAAGTGGDHRYLAPITNRVARYIGDISYSLYLWHFPTIILIGALVPLGGVVEDVSVLAVVFVLSALTYFFLEDPIRHSNWLEPKDKKWPHGSGVHVLRMQIGGLIALALVATAATLLAFERTAPNAATPAVVRAPVAAPAGKTATLVDAHSVKIQVALAESVWPELRPSIDQLGAQAKAPEWTHDGCLGMETKALDDPIQNAERCVYGNPAAEKTAVVMGDSMAVSYMPGLRAALEPQGYKILVYTVKQCPAELAVVLNGDKSPHPRCDEFRAWALGQVEAIKPDLVLMASNYTARLASGATGEAAVSEWAAGAQKTYTRVAAAADAVIVLAPPPGGKSLDACATRTSKPADCVAGIDVEESRVLTSFASAASAAKVKIVNTSQWYCAAESCPSFVGTTPVYADGSHLTAAFSTSLAPLISEVLKEATRTP